MLRYAEKPLTIAQIWKMSLKLAGAKFFQMYFIFMSLSVLAIFPRIIWNEPSINLIIKNHPAGFGVYWLLTIIFSMLIWPFVFHQLSKFMEGSPAKFSESLKLAVKKFPTVMMMFFLTCIIYIFGFICLILPAIFLLVMFTMCIFLIIFENEGAVDSLGDSIRLVWGNWWRTFIVVYLPPLIIFFILLLIKIGLVAFLLKMSLSQNNVAWISSIFQFIFYPLISIYLYPVHLLQWHDLKLRRLIRQNNKESEINE
jgi:hypothetical protein